MTSTWRAPAWTAASVLAVASPRSLWQWTLTVAWSPTSVDDPLDQRAELGRDRVADGVRDVDRGGAGLDDGLVDLEQVVDVGARGVLGGELDLGVAARAARGRGGPSGPPPRAPVSRSIRSLCLRWMSLVAMKTWRCGRSATLIASIARCGSPSLQRASAATAMPPRRLLGDPADRLEVARRGGREAGLDDVDLEPRELAGDLELLGGGQPGAGRLLPVAQGRVEDADAARRARTARRAAVRRALIGRAPGVVAAACAWPASTSTGSRNGIWARSRAPTRSIEVVAVGRAQPLELLAAGLVLGDPAVGERAVLDLARGPAASSRGRGRR